MKASMEPFDAASKHSNPSMSWPLAKTSILNLPALVSSTILAICSAVRCTSSERAHAVDIRHWILGCAMALGASTSVTAIVPPAVARNFRRLVISPGHELMVGALGDVIPRTDQRLELGEGRVDLSSHGRFLGLLLDDLGGKLLELAHHRCRELE